MYRLVNESEIPTLTASLIANTDSPVSSKAHWAQSDSNPSKCPNVHALLLRSLGKEIHVRFSVKFMSLPQMHKEFREGKLDLSFSSMTNIPGRFDYIKFSEPYLSKSKPGGIFIAKKLNSSISTSQKRLVMGVCNFSLHHHYALKNLKNDFRIISYNYVHEMLEALRQGTLDLIFSHPAYFDLRGDLKAVSGFIAFGGATAIGVHENQDRLLSSINLGLERLSLSGVLNSLEDNFTEP